MWSFFFTDVSNSSNNTIYETTPYNEIIKGLFVGDIASSKYHWNKFHLIVNCTKQIPFQSSLRKLTKPQSIRIPIDDHPDESMNMYMYLTQYPVLDAIHQTLQRGERVLIHCHAGQQRSCAVAACYLMKYYNMKPEDAVIKIKEKRHVAFYCGVNFVYTLKLMHSFFSGSSPQTPSFCLKRPDC
jgi:Dual specificity phosphatase, catalytic domain